MGCLARPAGGRRDLTTGPLASDRQPIEATNLDRYGHDPLPWSRALEAMLDPPPMATWFLSTTLPDGRPHVAGVGAGWHDGYVYFTAGAGTRKARNLAVRPASSFGVSLKGLDLVLEGEAEMVVDPALVAAIVERFRAGGWPAEVDGTQIVGPYSAPSAGPPPWDIYLFRVHTAFGVATEEPSGATRWRFANSP